METRQDNRSLGELFADLTRDMSALVRQEVELARTEMTQKATETAKSAGMMAAGGAVLYAGFLSLIAFVTILLVTAGMPLWGASLLVTLIVLAAGAVLVVVGRNAMRRTSLAPRQTVETLKEDVQWMKNQTT